MADVPNSVCAADIMRTKLITIRPETSFCDALREMLWAQVTGLPITDIDGSYLGMFSEKCCIRMLAENPEMLSVRGSQPIAREAMTTKLVVLRDSDDVFDGISKLLENRVSGAPVLDQADRFLGVFSEKTSMSTLARTVFDGVESASISGFIDRDESRIVDEMAPMADVIERFATTVYRRLPVLHGDQVVGQISRRDVIMHPEIFKRLTEPGSDEPLCPHQLTPVLELADKSALTIHPELDLWSIISTIMNSQYRRLPVLENGLLVGQISRRDVLQAVINESQKSRQGHRSTLLYLSALGGDTPSFA